MVVHWILFLLIHSVSIASASDQVLWAEFNSNVTLCCNLTLKETEALVFSVNDQRLSSLVLNPNSEPKSYVSKSARNWIFDRKKRNDICATKLDNQLTEGLRNSLGDTIEKKFITLKFYEQAKIDEFPRNLRVREGSSQVIKCNASGFPDLYVVWRLKNGKVLNHSQKVNSSNTGNNSRSIILPLELTNIHPDQHGEVYVCEARTSQPVNSQTATRTVMLEVNLYPKINMSTNVIYTDLGVEEKFNIIVTGYPRPTLNCSDLPLGDPRLLSEQPQGGTLAYPVVINRVTLQHLHEYTCTANNSLASVNEKLELTGVFSFICI
ncbi:unnamed protein product [Heterobilharzia americana]|nr:unnamed protein product [Heterobilharzia americana]